MTWKGSAVLGGARGANAMATEGGANAPAGIKTNIVREGNIVRTQVYVDLTGAQVAATDKDVIGVTADAVGNSICRFSADESGEILTGKVTCLEVPTGGSADVDFWHASVDTAEEDTAADSDGTTAVIATAAGAWTLGLEKAVTVKPVDDYYLLLSNGAASGAGTYTAGIFLIELIGYTVNESL